MQYCLTHQVLRKQSEWNRVGTHTANTRSRVQAPLKSWIFFRLLYAIAKIAIITARIILHLISYPQFTYDLFHMHHSHELLSLILTVLSVSRNKYFRNVWRNNGTFRLDIFMPENRFFSLILRCLLVSHFSLFTFLFQALKQCKKFVYTSYYKLAELILIKTNECRTNVWRLWLGKSCQANPYIRF